MASDAVAVSMRRVPIHVEGQLKPGCVVPPQEVSERGRNMLVFPSPCLSLVQPMR